MDDQVEVEVAKIGWGRCEYLTIGDRDVMRMEYAKHGEEPLPGNTVWYDITATGFEAPEDYVAYNLEVVYQKHRAREPSPHSPRPVPQG